MLNYWTKVNDWLLSCREETLTYQPIFRNPPTVLCTNMYWYSTPTIILLQSCLFPKTSLGALPLTTAVYPSDPRTVPIVYDCPACDTILNTSLLDCPRIVRFSPESINEGVLGGLSVPVTSTDVLSHLVGVSCEGTWTEQGMHACMG